MKHACYYYCHCYHCCHYYHCFNITIVAIIIIINIVTIFIISIINIIVVIIVIIIINLTSPTPMFPSRLYLRVSTSCVFNGYTKHINFPSMILITADDIQVNTFND